ncbi:hypothetical protein PTKIN_Ptkin09bG0031200 [Pterospermum kingtungense]
MSLVDNIEGMELQQVLDKMFNWQVTASSFIDHLSNEYSEYLDIAQPIQVAIYEMKLGLSLFLLSGFQKRFLDRIQEDNMDRVMLISLQELIYSFMRFPRRCTSESVVISYRRRPLMFSSLDMPCITKFSERELCLLEKMVTISNDINNEKVSVLQVKVALYNNVLLLEKIFSTFASIWVDMKIQGRNQEDLDGQSYKFRPLAFRIENVKEVDISALGKLLVNDNFIQWQELLSEEESTETMQDGEKMENLEDDWNLIEESILINMINMHNQLFGSSDLVVAPGSFQIRDVDRLHSFIGAYTLGVGMIKVFWVLVSSTLDAKLVQEHLLQLCWEHEQKFPSSQNAAARYKFYKDSNAHIMAKMVELLTALKQRVLTLLSEWEDDPCLLKVWDVIEMLLAIPLSTPLAKSLSGLQFLLNWTWILQENGSKFSLSDKTPNFSGVLMAKNGVPTLGLCCLMRFRIRYDINAAKQSCFVLLLNLYIAIKVSYKTNVAYAMVSTFLSVLHPRNSSDIVGHDQSTIASLEEFIQRSSIDEFRKHLQLLFAFLGQIITGRSLEIYSSVMELIESNRTKMETELNVLNSCMLSK